jgi:hypothetical protein
LRAPRESRHLRELGGLRVFSATRSGPPGAGRLDPSRGSRP